MRCELFLLVFVFNLYSVMGNGVYGSENRAGYYENDDKDKKVDSKCYGGMCDDDEYKCDGGKCDYDDEKYLYEPCYYSDDIDCVRKFFATYGQCSVVYHEDKKPVYRDINEYYLPKFNLTLIFTKGRLSNFEGKLEKFYINKKTGNLVISVEFKGIILDSRRGFFIVSRRGRESVAASDIVNATLPVTLTAVIPINNGLTLKALKESYVTGFVPQPVVQFYIGPRVTMSKDPAIIAAVLGIMADLPTALQEYFLLEAPNFFLAYLQKYICDYGISLNNVPNVRSIYNPNTQVLYNANSQNVNKVP